MASKFGIFKRLTYWRSLILAVSQFKLALMYKYTSEHVYTNIRSSRRDESNSSFPLQEGIFEYLYNKIFVYIFISYLSQL